MKICTYLYIYPRN